MTFRCNSKENLHHLGGPLDHHFWPITTLSHISHISNTKKWPTWGRSEGVTRIVTHHFDPTSHVFYPTNALSLNTFFELSDRRTASSIEE